MAFINSQVIGRYSQTVQRTRPIIRRVRQMVGRTRWTMQRTRWIIGRTRQTIQRTRWMVQRTRPIVRRVRLRDKVIRCQLANANYLQAVGCAHRDKHLFFHGLIGNNMQTKYYLPDGDN